MSAAMVAALTTLAGAQGSWAPDRPEPGSVDAIAQFTTETRFLSPWVAYVPDAPTVPSPSRFLGRLAGAPGELSTTSQIYGYLRALDAASPRVRVQTIGQTFEGRDILLVAIADEQGIADLDRLKAATAALADPRRTPPDAAERLLTDARPFYFLNAGLHADESGSPEMVMELAYRLAVSEQPMIDAIRRRLVVLINPVANPDGRDKMADWYYRYLKSRTDYDTLPRQSPPYWGRYVYVDANRDAHQLILPETRAVSRMFHEYHPQVVHDLHESIPLLQTWNGTGPYNPHLDPIVTSEFLEMSFHEVTTLTSMGMPGVWTWRFGEAFGHHYLDSIAMNHNAIGRGYETFGNATAETVTRTLDDSDLTREWYRPLPPPRTFRWSMRNTVNYMQTAALAILDYSARHATEMLRNFYRKGHNSWQRGVNGPPYAFAIAEDQGDRGRVADLINLLRAQRIEVMRLRGTYTEGSRTFPPGTFIVPLEQPYRNYAVDLLTPQQFPADAEHEPYDDTSWALPMHFGIEAWPALSASIRAVAASPVSEDVRATGTVSGSGENYLLADTGQEALLAARFRLRDFRVEIAEESFTAGGVEYAPGSWCLPAQAGLTDALQRVAAELGLDFVAVDRLPGVPRHDAPPPRLGVWVPWADTDSIGWIRYVLDRRDVPYVYLRDEDVRAGGLRDRVDVIVYGHVRMDLAGQIHGIRPTAGPMPFTRTERFASHGQPVASDDITGGIGWRGLGNLQQFVETGGVLVTLGNGSTLVLDGGLVPNVRRARVAGVTTPGAELRTRFKRPGHAIAYGYRPESTVFRSNYPIYDAPMRWREMSYCTACLEGPSDPSPVLMEWGAVPGSDGKAEPILVSGGGRRLDLIEGKPAVFEFALGAGRVVVFNFNPIHRDLNRSDFRLLWNVLLNFAHVNARENAGLARH